LSFVNARESFGIFFFFAMQVTEYFEEVFLPDDIFMLIKLDIKRIQLLKLEVDAYSIAYR